MAKRQSLRKVIRSIQSDLSRLKRAGGPDFEKGKLKTALNALRRDVIKLDDQAGDCGYTLVGGDLRRGRRVQ